MLPPQEVRSLFERAQQDSVRADGGLMNARGRTG